MKREVSFEEISDGNLYEKNDLVKANCHGCVGCSDCCKGMGDSIVLDPYDINQLSNGLGRTFEELLATGISLGVQEGLILPHMGMKDNEDCCNFLDEDGRCKIHAIRPSVCRLFPLGRFYEGEDFKYFLQIHECSYKDRSKIKVKKWIDMEGLGVHEAYIKQWSKLVRAQKEELSKMNESEAKVTNLAFLKQFYLTPYDKSKDFYEQVYARMSEI